MAEFTGGLNAYKRGIDPRNKQQYEDTWARIEANKKKQDASSTQKHSDKD